MSEPDDKLQRAYRGLAREEPPASLDAAILAASRRAVAKPSFSRRWGMPVSLAAVLVLAIGVTLEMRDERPGVEVAPPESASAPTPMSAPLQRQEPEAKREETVIPSTAHPVERPRVTSAPAMKRKSRFAPAPEAPAPQAAPSAEAAGANLQDVPAAPPAKLEPPQSATSTPSRPQPEAQAAKRASGAYALGDATAPSPDPHAQLERIAKLRAAGRDAEADRALEAFRRDHPGYRMDDAMWARVKPRSESGEAR